MSTPKGSPPPMRGKAHQKRVAAADKRITPAYAGKSRKPRHRRKPVQDHPRLCGEKAHWYGRIPPILGSPPPMRGKGIPRNSAVFDIEDHPRLCGEKAAVCLVSKPPEGSPPPMRGKDKRAGIQFGAGGITPAYAGKSDFSCLCTSLSRGSPPPMRGKANKYGKQVVQQ